MHIVYSSLYITTHLLTNLGLSDKNPMILLTSEVAFPLDCAIVLAFGLIQYDAHPFPWGKESGANIGNSTPLTLSYDLHYRADLGEKKRWESVSHYTLVDINLFFFISCVWVRKSDPPLEVYYSPLFPHCSFCWSVGWSAGGFGRNGKKDEKMRERERRGRLVTSGNDAITYQRVYCLHFRITHAFYILMLVK